MEKRSHKGNKAQRKKQNQKTSCLRDLVATKKGKTQMKKLITICLVCVFASTVLADDFLPPSWRGLPGTVTAEWDSWSGFTGPMYPDSYSSNPEMTVYPPADAYVYTGATLLDEFHDRTNVIKLTNDYQLELWVANFYQQPPNPYKDIQVQITYYYGDNPAQFSWFMVNGIDVRSTGTLTSYGLENSWGVDIWNIRLEPNPASELFYIGFYDRNGSGQPLYPAYVDQIVIDTYCVPEPATICLLGLGTLSLIRRKH